MNRFVVQENLEAVLTLKARAPTIVAWNRLEGRPRRPDFNRALKAEVRDPLWLLTRQWQMGEFAAEDAGSPIGAKVAWRSDPVTEVRGPSGGVRPPDPQVPLESAVEARPVPLLRGGRAHDAALRLALGRRWQKLLEDNGQPGLVGAFRGAYRFDPPDPAAAADFHITAHPSAWQVLAAAAGRAIDGGSLLLHLQTPAGKASDGLGLADPQKSAVDGLGDSFKAWAAAQAMQPADDLQCWQPRRLDHQVALTAPAGGRPAAIAAPEYRGGHLDWYDFDSVRPNPGAPAGAPAPTSVKSFLPSTVHFNGMPDTRHWAFEEGSTNFGGVAPDTTDLSRLLLVEFGLVFANDWFLLPIDVPVGAGTLTQIRGLAVTNTFGERFWIDQAVSVAGPTRTWRMFQLSGRDGVADARLFVPGTTVATLESKPVESVSLIRDEVSNMVWGVETAVQLPDGSTRRGRESALELHARYQAAVPPAPPPGPGNAATVKYTLMTPVPEHWIPFVPVHIPNDNREIQLQRAAMPRLLEGTAGVIPEKIRPLTQLLREGLDGGNAYFIAEEEVERSGTVVDLAWQRCRAKDGRVVLWLGYQRGVGRGEGTSGLAFDTLAPKAPGA